MFFTKKEIRRIIGRFALLGLVSGGLGFGLGGLWISMGSIMPDALFKS